MNNQTSIGLRDLRQSSAFTLLEAVLYIGLFAILLSGAVTFTYQILGGSEQLESKTLLQEEANFLLRKFEWALTGVEGINLPAPNSSGAVLSINKQNFSFNPLFFDLSGDELRLRRGGGSSTSLNSENLEVSELNFVRSASGSGPESIKVNFKLNGQPFTISKSLRQ